MPATTIAIGKLRERVTLQAFTVVQDIYGQPIETWTNLATNPTVWANIKTKPGGERFTSGAEQVIAQAVHTVTIRYRTDVTVQMRVVLSTRIFYVENVYDPTGRKEYLALECREELF